MLQQVPLGQTGITVSKLGLGTVKFGRNTGVKYPQQFAIPSDNQIQNLLALAKDLNINLLDTAPAYGNSEERLGKLLQNRHDWVIISKAGEEFIDNKSYYNFNRDYIIKSVQRSLTTLKTDYLDLLLIHSNGDDLKIIEQDNVFDALDLLKQQGLIRSYGMSTKTIDGGILAAKLSDAVMVTYNSSYLAEKPVIDTACELQKGVLIKKALASGHNNAKESINFALNTTGVTSAIIGTINLQHLQDNVQHACGIA